MTELTKAVQNLLGSGFSLRKAAAHLGMPESTLRSKLRRSVDEELEITPAPDHSAESLEDLLARKRKAFTQDKATEAWDQLIGVDVKTDGPIGLLVVGDPHVDDDHCDIIRLEHDLTTVGKTKGFYAGHVGDLTNNWVGRLAALYANQRTTFAEGLKLTEWMLGLCPNLFTIGGNHDCHDEETEALTRRGWVRGPDVRADDEVLTLNVERGRAEWNPILGVVRHDIDGEMISIESQSVSALVTPGHRVLHRKRVSAAAGFEADLRYSRADELPHRFALPMNSDEGLAGVDLTDDQIRLAGWILTDGGIHWGGNTPRITIYQSKPIDEIVRVLESCGIDYRVNVREREILEVCGRPLVKPPLPQQEIRLSAEMSRRVLQWVPEKGRLPDWVDETSRRQFDVLLDALVAGDGTWDGADPESKTVAVLHGTKSFLDSVQQVAVRRGWSARISVARDKDYRLNLCRRKEVQLERSVSVRAVPYKGTVWCLTVPNSNFMVRRRGAAHFSGNCWNRGMDTLSWIVRQGGTSGVLRAHGARLALRWPNGHELRVHARHDFPGRSQYSSTHGHKRSTLFGHRDHLYVAGHLHVDEARAEPYVDGSAFWAFRVSGYKVFDDYADEKGFIAQRFAPSVALILDPTAKHAVDQIKPFWDVEIAADYLTWLRKRASKS